MRYDPNWILAVLEDLAEFCGHNEMPDSASSIRQTQIAVEIEIQKNSKQKVVRIPTRRTS